MEEQPGDLKVPGWIVAALLVVGALSLGFCIGWITAHRSIPAPPAPPAEYSETLQRVKVLERDVVDLDDRLRQWRGRDSMRKSREKEPDPMQLLRERYPTASNRFLEKKLRQTGGAVNE